MKFQNPFVELQFNNAMTEGCLCEVVSSHPEGLQPQSLPSARQGPALPPPGVPTTAWSAASPLHLFQAGPVSHADQCHAQLKAHMVQFMLHLFRQGTGGFI